MADLFGNYLSTYKRLEIRRKSIWSEWMEVFSIVKLFHNTAGETSNAFISRNYKYISFLMYEKRKQIVSFDRHYFKYIYIYKLIITSGRDYSTPAKNRFIWSPVSLPPPFYPLLTSRLSYDSNHFADVFKSLQIINIIAGYDRTFCNRKIKKKQTNNRSPIIGICNSQAMKIFFWSITPGKMKACLPAVKCLTLRYTSDEKNKFALPLTQSFKILETNDDNQSRSIFSHFVVWFISRIINREKQNEIYHFGSGRNIHNLFDISISGRTLVIKSFKIVNSSSLCGVGNT